MAVVSVFFFIGSATCVVLGALEHPSAPPNGETIPLIWQLPMFIYLLAAIFFLVSVLVLIIIVETARRLDRFDEYKAELQKKMGK
jgi:heme/copper-type cytochrome/quinol oxidase subunit 2